MDGKQHLGVGDKLAKKFDWITRWDKSSCGGCTDTREEMNEDGPELVLLKIDYYVAKVQNNARGLGFPRPPASGIKWIIQRICNSYLETTPETDRSTG
jgi:hypothetical protein